LEQLHKGFFREQLEQAAVQILDAGISCMWFFLIGGPKETEQTFQETLDFIDRFVDPEDMVYLAAGLRIYPGTPLHRLARLQGSVEPDDDLLHPTFYLSSTLSADRCYALIEEACARRANCVPAWETTPSPEMIRQALALREQVGPEVPMFRLLIQVRRELTGL